MILKIRITKDANFLPKYMKTSVQNIRNKIFGFNDNPIITK